MCNLNFEYLCITCPAKIVVCPKCGGVGVHDHDAFSGGLTADDFQDPDFNRSYLAGVYDVTCTECDGKNVVKELDKSRCSAELLEKIEKAEYQEYLGWQESEGERLWGA